MTLMYDHANQKYITFGHKLRQVAHQHCSHKAHTKTKVKKKVCRGFLEDQKELAKAVQNQASIDYFY